MITREQAGEAGQLRKWCEDLELSEAFRAVFLAELAEREAEHDRCGCDVAKKPRERAEHHRALKLARELTVLVARRKAEALAVLAQWKEEQG